ncbi:neuronal-specific septin-3-like [Brienomyrus brachyistius]|uniref:neuronal-specific septin-3-like n=1 Tax=Brienomyrus brachyistius TaxID=42636 RepID=UPI0020B328AA|nr:neuronal-specific septin-3-like [Brienomyrus brachyistius]
MVNKPPLATTGCLCSTIPGGDARSAHLGQRCPGDSESYWAILGHTEGARPARHHPSPAFKAQFRRDRHDLSPRTSVQTSGDRREAQWAKGLRQPDGVEMLGKVVSIVPVIAKADTLTLEERLDFKARIRQNLQDHGIRVYPQREYDEDEDEALRNDKIRDNIPFAVVGTDKEHQVNGNKVLGRKTKWGIIEVENAAHCEFANLRDLLIRSHLQDLKDVTQNHYEEYRVRRLNESNARGLELSPVNGSVAKSDTESHL